MALDDFQSNFLFFLRWIHILAGITWLGHLYFFNFVNANFQLVLEKELKPKVNPQLMFRALFWFRWGAMITFLAGITLFLAKYMSNVSMIHDDGGMTGRAAWIMFGMTLGIIMWFNVWFIIWPAQRTILNSVMKGTGAPADLVARAGRFSRINTYLSGPMLFGMIAPNNYGAFNVTSMVVCSVVGYVVILGLFKMAPKVGLPPAS